MKIDKILGKNMDLTSAIEEYVISRVDVLAKLFRDEEPSNVSVEVGRTSEHHNKGDVFYAEFTADVNGNVFRASENSEDLYEAIDKVQGSIRRQLVDWKDKKKDMEIRAGRNAKLI